MSSSTSTSTTTTTTTTTTSAAPPSSSSSSSVAPAPAPTPAPPSSSRPRILYPDSGPEPPFPLRMEGEVISGFGRGSKELGIPTANLPVDGGQTPWIAGARSGVYFGWASLALPASHPDSSATASQRFQIYPMVMSIGYNPFYKNAVRSAEVHVLRRFGADFYGCAMRLLILGFVREERDYDGLDALVADIGVDCEVARRSLAREAWTPREGIVLETETETEGGDKEEKIRGLQKGTLDGSWLVRE